VAEASWEVALLSRFWYVYSYIQEVPPMTRLKLDEDIQPLSKFRANAAAMLERVRSTRRPLVLTQRGHSAAVVVGVAEYERLVDEIELLRDIRIAEQQIADGDVIPHDEFKKQVLARLRE
jgi:prevent-host-death family protein